MLSLSLMYCTFKVIGTKKYVFKRGGFMYMSRFILLFIYVIPSSFAFQGNSLLVSHDLNRKSYFLTILPSNGVGKYEIFCPFLDRMDGLNRGCYTRSRYIFFLFDVWGFDLLNWFLGFWVLGL